jgi:hypothetical protein
MEGRAPFLAALTLLIAISACESRPPVPTPTAAQPTATLDATACQQLISAVKLDDGATIRAAEGCRFNAAGADAAQALLAASTNLDTIWAALWVYSASGSDPAPVRPFVTSQDPSVRAMAAATLIAFGDRAGLAAAQDLLAQTGPMLGSFPPISIDTYIVGTLVEYVLAADAPASAPSTDGAAYAQAWAAWLATRRDALQFAPADGVWRMP